MIRILTLIGLACLSGCAAAPVFAQDNNPFSGAREIRVVMVRDRPPVEKSALQQKRVIAAKSQHPVR